MDILWLHGFPVGPAMWDRMVAEFGGLAPLLIRSEASSVDAMADIALRDADAAGLDTFHLVGFSMGGYVAFRILERAPERVRGLVLADTRAGPDDAAARAKRDALVRDVNARGSGPAVGFLSNVVSRDANPDLHRFLAAMAERFPSDALIAAVRAMRDRPDSRALLSALRVPALVVVGADDAVTPPEEARAMAEAMPDARLAVLDGAGHFAPLEAEEAFESALRDFLAAAAERTTAGSPTSGG